MKKEYITYANHNSVIFFYGEGAGFLNQIGRDVCISIYTKLAESGAYNLNRQ